MTAKSNCNGYYSKIHRRMWNDAKFRSLSPLQPCGQALWFRFLCGPELGVIPGLFAAREAGLADSLKWSLKPFRESFRELFQNGMAKADWEEGLVWIPNAIHYNPPANPNVVISWASPWADLPECQLKSEAFSAICDYLKERGEPFLRGFTNHCRNHCRNHSANDCPNIKEEREEEREVKEEHTEGGVVGIADLDVPRVIRSVFAHYQSKRPRSFPRVHSGLDEWGLIRDRIAKDGFGAPDLCKCIDGYWASTWHQGQNERGTKYLDLELFMRDAKHVSKGIELAESPQRQTQRQPSRDVRVGHVRAEDCDHTEQGVIEL